MNRSVSLAVLKSEPNAKSDAVNLQRWLVALCAIRFDLERGQVIEECYPAGILSPDEELDVAFSSFPDSMSQGQRHTSIFDSVFSFRIRRRGSVAVASSGTSLASFLSGSGLEDKSTQKTRAEFSGSNVEYSGRHSKGTSFSEVDDTLPSVSKQDFPAVDRTSHLVIERSISGNLEVDGSTSGDSGEIRRSSSGASFYAGFPSPKLKPRSSVTTSPGESQHGKSFDEKHLILQESKEEESNGSLRNHSGPGSGAQRYLYGFVFNRQRQDERLKRGGEQKSVVVLSERPYYCVFKPLVQIAGPLFFDIGSQALEQVAFHVSHWPAPKHGAIMELSVSSAILKVHLPPAHTLPPGCGTPMDDFTSAMAPVSPLNRSVPQGIFHEVDLFGTFRGLLMELWVLWELILVGEPLLVMAPTPSQCCEAVAALVGLVAPLPCSVDFRPYFTIHDPDFAILNSLKEGEQVPPMILGVTNVFFLKALKSLKNVVSVGTTPMSSNRRTRNPRSGSPVGITGNSGRLPIRLQLSPLKRLSPTNLLKVARIKRDGPLCLMAEHREAFWTNYVSATKPDTTILNRLVDAAPLPRVEESMSVVNNEILRRHFLELTTNFLAPFGPFLRAIAPQEGASPFAEPPPLPPFDAHEFLQSLAARGPGKFLAKRLRANWLDLYRRFLKGPNFMPWFQRRRAVAEQEQHRIWRVARLKVDMRPFLSKMSEVEVIDMFHAVVRHLLAEMQMLPRAGMNMEASICQKLRNDLKIIYSLLPRDMQQLLLCNPQHAALLQAQREFTKLPGRPAIQMARGLESPALQSAGSISFSSSISCSQELVRDPLDLNKV
ncbi:hypothetical protein O6H91_07G088200 [Diphasiastrum complanatum]|uniref:Uncharacterized protein n=8 Tax=Diphasiastrum complanatum TaxID=34168 RepID=A0ACC2D7W1_DIPCM|nr:hypothetical protein O6H91_07G088200 [Diphasiastrum complanatum]KAJ7550202.1 hypothetical protein O6H91_07G088200 [Diphasiastrum complanatum]KAJ7550203.1 hypothetical protein O6H91_07G088200 [Diphasiastrum complanatum]KAJ7550204.1 hypothetical protein O6H91_07G088200 [Diphasiastrum complanatum]KAJ7550205.1 hypothetical protein O6H91_07G088200 [Diphasiastrum complanatum]